MVFGKERMFPTLGRNAKPITRDEVEAAVKRFEEYTASFTRARATHPTISYVVTSIDSLTDFANLDRWYKRDEGEHVGDFIIYRVHPLD